MEGRLTKVARVSARFSKSLARRRFRPNQEKVRSTTQRCGRTTKPFVSSLRLTMSMRSRELPRPEDLPPGIDPPRPISVTFIPATVFDNPVLLRINPEYFTWLLSLPLLERERLLGGNWKIRPAAGLYLKREWLRLHELGCFKSSPQKIIDDGINVGRRSPIFVWPGTRSRENACGG